VHHLQKQRNGRELAAVLAESDGIMAGPEVGSPINLVDEL
jgi:hypothetical protein